MTEMEPPSPRSIIPFPPADYQTSRKIRWTILGALLFAFLGFLPVSIFRGEEDPFAFLLSFSLSSSHFLPLALHPAILGIGVVWLWERLREPRGYSDKSRFSSNVAFQTPNRLLKEVAL